MSRTSQPIDARETTPEESDVDGSRAEHHRPLPRWVGLRLAPLNPFRKDSWAVRANHWLLRQLARALPSEENRLLGLTVAIGGICGLAAVAFHLAIRGAEALLINPALTAPGRSWIAWTIVVPTIGALVAGFGIHYLFPRARGSGIPEVKHVFASGSGRIRLRDGIGKFIVGALQIGCGASLGREGPTVHICSALASSLGRAFALSPSNQRRLIPVGAAAGIAAAFNAPIAAVTFVIEELVGSLNTTVLSGVVVAAALAAAVEHSILGEHPVFDVPAGYGLDHPSSLLLYAALGVSAAVVGTAFVKALLEVRRFFRNAKRVPETLRPAVGGVVTGLLAVGTILWVHTTGVTGGGYETLGVALRGNLALKAALVLCAAKLIATVFSYSSGGTGGIFAPSLFLGGMLGAAIGHMDHLLLGPEHSQVGAFALVGMGAVFAAIIRAPMTSVLIIFEMTGSYKLVLPLMISNTVAFVLARRWQGLPVYEALLEQDGIDLPHGAKMQPLLRSMTVASAMTPNPVVLDARWTVDEAFQRIKGLPYAAYPVVDADGRMVGVLTEARIQRGVAEGAGAETTGAQARMREFLRVGQSLRDALAAMHRLNIRQMCVVADSNPTRLLGVLTMSDVMRAALAAERASVLSTPPPMADRRPSES